MHSKSWWDTHDGFMRWNYIAYEDDRNYSIAEKVCLVPLPSVLPLPAFGKMQGDSVTGVKASIPLAQDDEAKTVCDDTSTSDFSPATWPFFMHSAAADVAAFL